MSSISSQTLKQLLSHLPSSRISLAFAYGSGVFHQDILSNTKDTQPISVKSKSPNMIDLIIAVDDSVSFHEENISSNRHHYSLLRHLGAKWVSTIQENFGANIYFNTLIPIDGHLIKYGIINAKHLINDLLDWESLYVSGRLHKPVELLVQPTNHELEKAYQINFQSAIHTSLLILPEVFTQEQLYLTIAGLSYSGDFRMIVGEDKMKVDKIVSPQLARFRHIYHPFLTAESMRNILDWNSNSKTFSQDCSSRVIFHHLNLLPKNVQQKMYVSCTSVNGRLRDLDDVLLSLSRSYDYPAHVKRAVTEIVWRSSWSQSMKSVLTAGMIKSLRYGGNKLIKMFRSFRRE